jgi:8-amino-7-oxononanoate synthase
MQGDIAPKDIEFIANKHNALLIVDEAHSSGVIGDNLLGWFDYFNITIKPNHIHSSSAKIYFL